MALSLEQTLQLAEEAYDAFEFEDMLRLSDQALALDPGSFDALELKGNAQAELGQWEEADETFEKLLEVEPKNAALILAAADIKIRLPGDDRERIEAGLQLIDRAWPTAKLDEALFIEAELLRGVALNQLGDCEDALGCFEQVLEVDPENSEAQLEKAIALFELGRFEAAKKDFSAIARDFPEEAWSFHYLGLIAERASQPSVPLFQKARALAPEEFPPPVHLEPEAFDHALQEAIASLPAHARPALENVIINVLPLPSEEEIREGLSPSILGVFQGTPLNERSPLEATDHQTARITLYQNNLERFASTRQELLEEIRITVLHEVGHLLGLDEDDLYERGLD